MRFLLVITSVLVALSGCKPETTPPQQVADDVANNLSFEIELISNSQPDRAVCVELGAEWATCNRFDIILGANDNGVIHTDWELYIHSVRNLLTESSELFDLEHITGDLYRITPTEQFDGFAAGEQHRLEIVGEFFELSKYDYIPGAFVVVENAAPRALRATATEDIDLIVRDIPEHEMFRGEDDATVIETTATRFDSHSEQLAHEALEFSGIFPTPLSVDFEGTYIELNDGLALELVGLEPASFDVLKLRAEERQLSLNGSFPTIGVVIPDSFTGGMAVSGAYRISIGEDGIGVSAYDERGLFYGLTTLVELSNYSKLPVGEVADAPRFEYRGIMLDVARNFHSKQYVLDLIDEMSRSKLNKLALHLTDDEGWRIEIPSIPELTRIGGRRCFDLDEDECLLPQLGSGHSSDNFGSGYYSREDFIEILTYAAARQVDVIPEIDMPAHARSAVVAMEARYRHFAEQGDLSRANEYRLLDPNDTSNVTTVQFYDRLSFINPCLESSHRFTATVINDVAGMYRDAGLSLDTWHFGGDEAKNIKLGGGFQDANSAELTTFQGAIDRSIEHAPFEQSPACQTLIAEGEIASASQLPSYWAIEVSKIAANAGFSNFQAWEDGLKYAESAADFATENTRVNFWEILSGGGAVNAHDWAKKDYDLIISVPDYLYFDFPQAIDQNERGYYWATRANQLARVFAFAPENLAQNASNSVNRDGKGFEITSATVPAEFHGMSAQLWSELIRNDEQAEYMMYPRLYAAAERAWHRAEWELDFEPGHQYRYDDGQVDNSLVLRDFQRFTTVLGQRILPRLDAKQISYRMPLPGARIIDGKLLVTMEIPGFGVEYSLDNGDTWNGYDFGVPPELESTAVVLRSTAGDRRGRIVALAQP